MKSRTGELVVGLKVFWKEQMYLNVKKWQVCMLVLKGQTSVSVNFNTQDVHSEEQADENDGFCQHLRGDDHPSEMSRFRD